MKNLLAAAVSLLFVVPAFAANITARPNKTNPTEETRVSFTTNHAVNTISDPIPACPSMEVIFEQGSTGAVSLYAVSPSDSTVALVEAATSLGQFSGDTSSAVTVATGKSAVRFVVDTVETSGESFAIVRCSRNLGAGVDVNTELLTGPWAEYVYRYDTTANTAGDASTIAANTAINFTTTQENVENTVYDHWAEEIIVCDDTDNVFNTYSPSGTANQTLVRSNFNAYLQTQTNPHTNALFTSGEADYMDNEPEICFFKDETTLHVVNNVNNTAACTDAEISNASTGGMASMFTLNRTKLDDGKYTDWAFSGWRMLPSANCNGDTEATIAAGTIGQTEFKGYIGGMFYSPVDSAYYVVMGGGGSSYADFNPGAEDGNGGSAWPNIESGIYKLNASLTGYEGGTTSNPFEYAQAYDFSTNNKGLWRCGYDFRKHHVWCPLYTISDGTDMELHEIYWPLRREVKVHDVSSLYNATTGGRRVRSIAVDSARARGWLGSNFNVTNKLLGVELQYTHP